MSALEITTTIILLISVTVFIFLERKFPYRKGIVVFREGFWLDLIWYTLIQSYLLKILIFDYIIQPIDSHYNLSSNHLVTSWPIAAQVLFFFVIHDFYIYWFHRWQHNSKILWRTHEAHHSNKEVDWLAGARSHSLEIIINQTVEFAPIVLLGANPAVVPIKALIDAVWGMYIHSNINTKMGKWQYIINGPEMHQWHHANVQNVYYSNFATKLALWDWLFGTAYLPGRKPESYGLPYAYPKDYFIQHVFAVKRVDENKLLRNKLFRQYFYSRINIMHFLVKKVNAIKKPISDSIGVPEPTAKS